MMRLDKFLTECGIGSRSECRAYIKKGKVTVGGAAADRPEQKIDEEADEICFEGERLCYQKYRYFLFHKPAGCVTANSDVRHRTVMDYFPNDRGKDLSPAGRLDIDTEGLLLITNDGAFSHRLTSPAHHVKKVYHAILDKPLPDTAAEQLREGIDIGDDRPTRPAELVILTEEQAEALCCDYRSAVLSDGHSEAHTAAVLSDGHSDIHAAALSITEGRYHQVKRMFHALGCEVLYLKRTQLGELTLDGVAKGTFRELTPEEVKALQNDRNG